MIVSPSDEEKNGYWSSSVIIYQLLTTYLHNNSDQKMRLYEVLPLCDSYFMAKFFDVAVIQEFVIKSSIYDSYLYK